MGEHFNIAMLSIHSCPMGKLGGRDTGGMNVYVRELACELGRRGHLVDIYTRTHHPEHECIVDLGENIRLVHLEGGGNDGMPKEALYAHLQDFICGIESFRMKDSLRYHLVHSHYWLSGLLGNQLKARWDVPLLTMFHTLGAVKNSLGLGEDETDLRIESERDVVGCSNIIIAATEKERADLVRYCGADPGRISVIPCGVNLDLFQPLDRAPSREKLGLDAGKGIILYVGRIERLKGIEKLLQALSQFCGGKELQLMVVGGDRHSEGEVESLRDMARRLGIQGRVTFVGLVAQSELPAFYSAADVCVIPSFYESFGMVALESLACGTPVVATDVGVMRSLIRHEVLGRVVRDNSPDSLARSIAQVFSSRDDRSEAIHARRSMVSGYSWPAIADRVLQSYAGALAGHREKVRLLSTTPRNRGF